MPAHKHAESMYLFANDALETDTPWERWEVSSDGAEWEDLIRLPVWREGNAYRRKPCTIRIGEIDVPEPVREPLKRGQSYWLAEVSGTWLESFWCDGTREKEWLEHGLIHLTKEAAELHRKALILVSGGKVD